MRLQTPLRVAPTTARLNCRAEVAARVTYYDIIAPEIVALPYL
jgi:hypothetical protein